MGNEMKCTARSGKKAAEGKAQLETSELIFRSPELKARIPLAEMKEVKVVDGELRVKTRDGGLFAFAVGAQAEKWREKILHPKSRVEKLGVKAGERVALLGEFDAEFVKELKGATKEIGASKEAGAAQWIFWSVPTPKELSAFAKMAKLLRGAAALWVVYPKGKKEITENDVLAAGRKTGLKDVKVVRFSATHTALKFVIPVDKR